MIPTMRSFCKNTWEMHKDFMLLSKLESDLLLQAHFYFQTYYWITWLKMDLGSATKLKSARVLIYINLLSSHEGKCNSIVKVTKDNNPICIQSVSKRKMKFAHLGTLTCCTFKWKFGFIKRVDKGWITTVKDLFWFLPPTQHHSFFRN